MKKHDLTFKHKSKIWDTPNSHNRIVNTIHLRLTILYVN